MHRTIHIHICCPHADCGKSLLDNSVKIGNQPSVHLIADKNGVRGDIYLSSLYDDFECIEPEELNILPGDIIRLYCPHCGKELPFADKCACKAKMVWLGIKNGGRVRICCRKDCHYHSLEFDDSGKLIEFISQVENAD